MRNLFCIEPVLSLNILGKSDKIARMQKRLSILGMAIAALCCLSLNLAARTPEALLAQARLQIETGHPIAGLNFLDTLSRQTTSNLWTNPVLFWQGVALYNAGYWQAADLAFQQCAGLAIQHRYIVFFTYAELCFKSGRLAKARDLYETVYQLVPDTYWGYQSVRRLLMCAPPRNRVKHIMKWRAVYSAKYGRLHQLMKQWELFCQSPYASVSVYERALSESRLYHRTAALDHYAQFISRHPDRVERVLAEVASARLLLETGRLPESQALWSALKSSNADSAVLQIASYYLARIDELNGLFPKAISGYTTLLSAANPSEWQRMACRQLLKLQFQIPDSGIRLTQSGAVTDPALEGLRGIEYLMLAKPESAIASFEKSLGAFNNSVEASERYAQKLYGMIKALSQKRDMSEITRKYIRQLLNGYPDTYYAWRLQSLRHSSKPFSPDQFDLIANPSSAPAGVYPYLIRLGLSQDAFKALCFEMTYFRRNIWSWPGDLSLWLTDNPRLTISLLRLRENDLPVFQKLAISRAARLYGINPLLLVSVIQATSAWDSGYEDAMGRSGIIPLTPAARETFRLELARSNVAAAEIAPAEMSILMGAGYLAKLLKTYKGDVMRAICAYCADPGEMDRIMKYGRIQDPDYIIECIGDQANADKARHILKTYWKYQAKYAH